MLPDSQTISPANQTRSFGSAAKCKKVISRHPAGDVLKVDLPPLGSTRLVVTRSGIPVTDALQLTEDKSFWRHRQISTMECYTADRYSSDDDDDDVMFSLLLVLVYGTIYLTAVAV